MKHIKWPPVLERPHPQGNLKVRFDPTIWRPIPVKPLTRFDWGHGLNAR